MSTPMDLPPEQEYEFYADPAHRVPAGPPVRRTGSGDSSVAGAGGISRRQGAEPPYDARPFIDVDPDAQQSVWYGTWCRVVWRPCGEDRTHRACAPFMDGSPRLGRVRLGCGLDEWAGEVGMELSDDEKLSIRNLVDGQLAERPYADIMCSAGKAHIELCSRPRWADPGVGGPFTGDDGWGAGA